MYQNLSEILDKS